MGSKVVVTTLAPERLTVRGLPVSLTLDLEVDPAAEGGEWI